MALDPGATPYAQGRAVADMRDDYLALRRSAPSPRKHVVAGRMRCYLAWRHGPGEGRGIRVSLRETLREAWPALRAALHKAEADPHTCVQLVVLASACERLLPGIAQVRNFERPAMHALFGVFESLPANFLVNWLDGYLRQRGAPRTHVPSALACAERGDGVNTETLLAASVPLALASRGATSFHELLGFCAALWRLLAVLARRSERSVTHRRCHARVMHGVRLALAEAGAASDLELGVCALGRSASLLAEGLEACAGRAQLKAAGLLERTAQFAAVHHRGMSLAGKDLGGWFADAAFSGRACLQALAQSSWIDMKDIDRSRFFRQLTGPTGPMHCVFSDDELAVLKSGLQATAAYPMHSDVHSAEVRHYLGHARDHRGSTPVALPTPDVDATNHREHFFKLVNADAEPSAGSIAESVVQRAFIEFDRARPMIDGLPPFKPFAYDTASFRQRIEDVYRYQVAQTAAVDLDLTDASLQAVHLAFAPFALVDGCWLRSMSAARDDTPAHAMLFQIFADEVGNGLHERNHANLYRVLMSDLGCALPGVWQEAFAQDKRMALQAFKAPAFLLAIDLACEHYVPELLGVNLCIEMAGLDGFYEAMSRNLERKGLDAAYWRIHICVDNLATGHARQSALLIERYLEAIASQLGEQCMQWTWERVWKGFLTMSVFMRQEMNALLSAAGKKTAVVRKTTGETE
jgi:hypothetical protein